MEQSLIKNDLRRKYAIRHLLSVTERTKEYIWQGIAITMVILSISYFMGHFFLYATGFYNPPMSQIIIHK